MGEPEQMALIRYSQRVPRPAVVRPGRTFDQVLAVALGRVEKNVSPLLSPIGEQRGYQSRAAVDDVEALRVRFKAGGPQHRRSAARAELVAVERRTGFRRAPRESPRPA